jgi:hypothetical protein
MKKNHLKIKINIFFIKFIFFLFFLFRNLNPFFLIFNKIYSFNFFIFYFRILKQKKL